VSRYQKGKTNLDFTEARDSEWQWHQRDHMQVRTSLQTDNHASTHHSVFLQAGCPSCRPTNSVKGTEGNCRVTVLGKLFTPIVPRRSQLQHQEAAASTEQCSSDRSRSTKTIPYQPVAEDVTLAARSAED